MVKSIIAKQETILYQYSTVQEAQIHISEMRNGGYGVMHEEDTVYGYMVKYFRNIR